MADDERNAAAVDYTDQDQDTADNSISNNSNNEPAPPPIAEEQPTPPPIAADPFRPTPELKAQFPNVFKSERRQYIEDFTAHFIAVIFSIGFFAIILAALLGFVDINDPTVSAFVGTAIGYAAGKIDPVLSRYFGSMTTTGPTK